MKTIIAPLSSLNTDDAALFTKWIWESRKLTRFDPDTLSYPRTVMAKVTKDDQPVAYVPIHPVLMVESFAPDPKSSRGDNARALHSIDLELTKVMRDTGMVETYFVASDYLAKFAISQGWEEVKGRVFRRKLTKSERSWEKDAQ